MSTLPDTTIWGIQSREIIDSRANPTVETTVILNSGHRGTSSVPSGASIGKYEALEIRDNNPARFFGMGVQNAVKHVNTDIAATLKNVDARNQEDIDTKMITLDGTPNKSALGANAILSVSMAASVACANALHMPLYQYVHGLAKDAVPSAISRIPTPIFNMINGGKHGAGNLNFQEFQVIPATNKPFHTAFEIGVTIYKKIKDILTTRNAVHSVGDEGGYAPNLFTNLEALEILMESIRSTSYQFGVDVFFGLDLASSQFKTARGYEIKDRMQPYSTKDFVEYLKSIHEKYHLLLLEDALDEDDWASWQELTKSIGQDVLIVGDDLLATNYKRLEQAIADKACSAILLKPNQIGTITEFLRVVGLAHKNDIRCIVSHRSGETTDTYIADLAVGINADYVKFGAPARGERIVKYNRLLAIEQELFPYNS